MKLIWRGWPARTPRPGWHGVRWAPLCAEPPLTLPRIVSLSSENGLGESAPAPEDAMPGGRVSAAGTLSSHGRAGRKSLPRGRKGWKAARLAPAGWGQGGRGAHRSWSLRHMASDRGGAHPPLSEGTHQERRPRLAGVILGGGHGLPAQLPQCPGWGLRAGGDEGAKQDRHGCCSGLARAGRYRERSPSSGLLRGPLSYLSRPGEQCPPPPLKKQRVGSERSLPGLPAHLQVPSSMVTGRAAPARRPLPLCHNSRLRQRPCLSVC